MGSGTRRQATLGGSPTGSPGRTDEPVSTDVPDDSPLSIPLVLVCDDRELVRAGIHHLLTKIDFVKQVDSFCSVEAACTELAGGRPPGALGVIGGAAIAELVEPTRQAELGLRLVVLLASNEPYRLSAAAELAASGYLFESSLSGHTLRSALQIVATGGATMPEAMAQLLLGRTRQSRELRITPRQLRVLQMIADGATNRVIAAELGLSVHAVKRDVAALLTASGCSNRTEVTVRALGEGLIPRPGAR